MFDYVFLIKWAGIVGIVIFSVRILLAISAWYFYEHTDSGKKQRLLLNIRGEEIVGYGLGRLILYLVCAIIVYLSIR